MPQIRPYKQADLSGGVQNATTRLLRKQNEIAAATNIILSEKIGAISRRLGYEEALVLRNGKDGLGAFVHRYRTGSRLFGIVNKADNSNAELFYKSGASAVSLATNLLASAKTNAANFLEQLFIVGRDSSGNFMTPINVDSTPSVSTTRNILDMPKAAFIAEFNRQMIAMNVEVTNPDASTSKYADRMYYSSAAQGFMTTIQGIQNGNLGNILVDSVRYPKTGMVVDIYSAGTDTLLYSPTILSVDKNANRIYFSSLSQTFATTDVNTSTEVITLPSTTLLPTGTQVRFSSDTTLPSPLVANTTYYVINISGTTIKVADTLAHASGGTAINLTTQGTGVHTISTYMSVNDNDEVWLSGTKGKQTTFWNTDWPVPEDSDWTAVPAGTDEDNTITGYAKTNNRLFVFTKNSISKFTSMTQAPVVISNAVGSLSHNSIAEIQGWLIFPHYTGLWAYNDSSNQLRLLSRGVKNYFDAVPLANWAGASAGVVGNVYKLSCGQITELNGQPIEGNLRLVYDFDSNAFTPELHSREMRYQLNWTESTERKPYFQDNTGRILKDESGTLDINKTIPMEIEIGRNHFNLDQQKEYMFAYFYSARAQGALVQFSVDNGPWKDLGQLTEDVTKLVFKRGVARGVDINYRIVHNHSGDGMMLEGVTTYYSVVENYIG